MADNVAVTEGTGTDIATDEIGGTHYQRVKVTFGIDGVATDASATDPLPVAVGTVPVTGTFWQATQPISGTVGVSGSVAVTGSFYQATQPVSIASMPSTPVTGTFYQATQPVSGTFWQATQPVSGTVTANAGSGTFAVSGTFWQATQPVSGTFWQATQPVSGPLTDAQLRASAVPVSLTSTTITGTVAATQSGTWNVGSITTLPALVAGTALVGKVGLDQTTPGTTNAVSIGQLGATTIATNSGVVGAGVQRVVLATDVALPTGSNTLGTTTGPTLTKGTQGSSGYSVQDLKDAGRTSIMVTATVASTATSETLITLTKSSGLAGTTTASSNTITTAKRFRIQGMFASARNTTGTTAGVATLRLRAAVGGSTTASSPLQLSTSVALPAAATSVNFPTIDIPDGFELDSNGATNTWGMTILHPQWVTGSVVATFDLTLIGYEY